MTAAKIVLAVFLILLVLQTFAYADEIFLKSGESLEGEVVEQNESSVLIRVEGGTIVSGADEIDRIVPKELPPSLQKSEEPAGPAGTAAPAEAEPAAEESSIEIERSKKPSINFDTLLDATESALQTFHRELIKSLEKWSLFRKFNNRL